MTEAESSKHVRRLAAAVSLALGAGAAATAFPAPPHTAVALPATIQAENFDRGGEGSGYHELSPTNTGGLYRTDEAVDIVASSDASSGGFVVNNFQTGEWLAYTANVAAAASFDIALRVSNGSTGPQATAAQFHVEIDGVNVSGTIRVPKTGNWDTFQWVNAKLSQPIAAGARTIKVVADSEYFNFDAIRVTTSAMQPAAGTGYAGTPYSGAAIAVPKLIEAEYFDKGGEGVAYHDLSSGNAGGQLRTSENVDITTSTGATLSPGGQYVISNFQAGEWLAYSINVPSDGSYDLAVHAANDYTGAGTLHIEVDGVNVSGAVSVPKTGGWDSYRWFGKTGVALKAGKHVLKLVADTQYFNVNALSVIASLPTGGAVVPAPAPATPPAAPAPSPTIPVVGGEVKWACDFESRGYCGFEEQSKNEQGHRSTFVAIPRTGKSAIRLTTQAGDSEVHSSGAWERDDLSLGTSPDYCNPGQEEWWAHSVLFPSDYAVPNEGGVVMNFHDDGGGANANFHFNSLPTGLRMQGFGGDPRHPSQYRAELGPVQRNVWYDLVYHVKWSPDSDGFMEAWMNGRKVLAYSGPTLYKPAVPCYLKLANYHDPAGRPSSIIHDRVVRGTSAAAVAIGALEGMQ